MTSRITTSGAEQPTPGAGSRGGPIRCLVAPHPDLKAQIDQAVRELRGAAGGLLGHMLVAREKTAAGLNDGLIVPGSYFPVGTPLARVRSAAAERAPLRGTLQVIVVLVDFDDQQMTEDAAHFEELFFSDGVLPDGSVREYFQEVSHGLVDIAGQVVGPYRLPLTMAAYAHGESGTGNPLPNARTMALDAALAADPNVDFTPFDNDNNGFVDAFIVVHAGAGAEVTNSPSDIWSHKWVLPQGELSTDTKKIFAYLTVPEDSKIGVCCHELGHLLFGWPDLYDTDGTSSGLGDWCLMASGSWNAGGDIPAHASAWCKVNQGWVNVVTQRTTDTVPIADVKTGHTVYRLWKDGGGGTEYFLVENRQKTGYDKELPGGGMLVYHIDDSTQSNANEAHYKVGLVQADGLRDLEAGADQGDGGDPFPGSQANASFTGLSTPNSHSYAGVKTCVSITDIGPSGPVMSAKLSVSCTQAPTVTEPTIRRGSRGDAVRRLEQALVDLGFDPGRVDSVFGRKTETALRTYQRTRGIIADGVCGPQTWAAILAETE